MALSTLYGVNGVGKDTIGAELLSRHPDTQLTSESRLFMYILGITSDYRAQTKASREQYKQLEDTPQKRMLEIQDTDYMYLVDDLKKRENTTILLSHLVFALHLDKEITYLDSRETPEWFVDANDTLVQLVAPPEVILERRMQDAAQRDRGAFTLEDIQTHQRLCDRKWEKLTALAVNDTVCISVENINKDQAAEETEHAIFR